jgi:four helix bundle protein
MPTVQRFEDLLIWQKARDLMKNIYPLTFIEPIASDYRFKDQIRGTLGSIMDNIAEGFERGSKNEFVNSLTISKGETGELKSQLYRGHDLNYFSKTDFELFYAMADEETKMLTSMINYLNRSEIKGQKFKDRLK